MSFVKSLNVVIEDVLTEVVMRRLLSRLGYTGMTTYRVTRGNGAIKANVDKYKGASRVVPHIVLTDLDRYPCPPALLTAWSVGKLPPTMLLRIAVRETEAWLLADRNNFATFLMAAVEKVPNDPEALADPKQAVFGVVRKSRRRRLIEEMVPSPGAHIGPLYNERMCDFALNHWDIEVAAGNAPSLARNIARISAFLFGRTT